MNLQAAPVTNNACFIRQCRQKCSLQEWSKMKGKSSIIFPAVYWLSGWASLMHTQNDCIHSTSWKWWQVWLSQGARENNDIVAQDQIDCTFRLLTKPEEQLFFWMQLHISMRSRMSHKLWPSIKIIAVHITFDQSIDSWDELWNFHGTKLEKM